MKYFYVNCKTGGTKTKMSLLSLYGLVLDDNFKVENSIDLKIKPNNNCYVFDINHLIQNKIDIIKHNNEAINIWEASIKFNDFCCSHGKITKEKLTPIGFNVSYNFSFIKKYLMKEKEIKRTFSSNKIDIANISNFLKIAGKIPNIDCDLVSLAKHFNILINNNNNKEEEKTTAEITINLLKSLIYLTS